MWGNKIPCVLRQSWGKMTWMDNVNTIFCTQNRTMAISQTVVIRSISYIHVGWELYVKLSSLGMTDHLEVTWEHTHWVVFTGQFGDTGSECEAGAPSSRRPQAHVLAKTLHGVCLKGPTTIWGACHTSEGHTDAIWQPTCKLVNMYLFG